MNRPINSEPRRLAQDRGVYYFAQSTFNVMDAVARKIDHLNLQALSPEDRENFRIALENIKQTIQNKLDAPSQQNSNLV
jgi:hypothetical protein